MTVNKNLRLCFAILTFTLIYVWFAVLAASCEELVFDNNQNLPFKIMFDIQRICVEAGLMDLFVFNFTTNPPNQ